MKKGLRIAGSVIFALFIYFPWLVTLPEVIYFLGGLCFMASFHVLLNFRQLKMPWNIAHLVTPAIIGVFLIVYVAQI